MTVVPLGLYLHVPFCATACFLFVHFIKKGRGVKFLDAYLEAMDLELTQACGCRGGETVFGVGDSRIITSSRFRALGLRDAKDIGSQPDEWTVEMAPSVVRPDKLKVLKSLGVTRLSMGVQTFSQSF